MAAAAPKGTPLDFGIDMFLWSSGPFFGNPIKAPLQAVVGQAGYHRAYAHFARDHNTPTNLVLHVVALTWQVGGNFALLARLDELLRDHVGGEYLAAATAASWAALLAVQPAPAASKVLAVATLGAGYAVRKRAVAVWERTAAVVGLVEIGAAVVAISLRAPLPVRPVAIALLVGLWAALNRPLQPSNQPPFAGALRKRRRLVAAVVVPAILALSNKPPARPVPPVFVYGLLGWVVSLLTGESAYFLHSWAYTASFLQGIAHGLSKEAGTLTQLYNTHDELAHCTYFPVLLLHRVQMAIANRR